MLREVLGMKLPKFKTHHIDNPAVVKSDIYGPQEQEIVNLNSLGKAWNKINSGPGYSTKPLVALPFFESNPGIGIRYYRDKGAFKNVVGNSAELIESSARI